MSSGFTFLTVQYFLNLRLNFEMQSKREYQVYVTLSSNLEINFVVLNLIYFYSSLNFDYAYSGIKKSNSVNENPQTETQPTTACSRPTTEKLEKSVKCVQS